MQRKSPPGAIEELSIPVSVYQRDLADARQQERERIARDLKTFNHQQIAAYEELSKFEQILTFINAAAFYEGEMLKAAMQGMIGQLSGSLTEVVSKWRAFGLDLYTNDPDGAISLVTQCITGLERIRDEIDNGEYLRGVFDNRPGKFGKLKKTWEQVNRGGAPSGMRLHNQLLAELALERRATIEESWQESATAIKNDLAARGEDNLSPTEYGALKLLEGQKYGDMGNYLKQQIKRYKKVVSKTGF